MTLRIETIPCLADNYAYLLIAGDRVAVVDPGDSAPIELALQREGRDLDEIWCTHHHLDHVAGVLALLERRDGVVVRGSEYDGTNRRIEGQTVAHADGSRFDFAGHEVEVMAIPGHTLGAIAFVVDGVVFSGDTLFLGGCGRVFEGTMPMMAASMRTLRALPPSMQIYCGHEYTVANLRFAKTVEPESAVIAHALDEATRAVAEGRPTVPGTIARELETNPFVRFDRPEVARELAADASFARLREAKNAFRG